MSIAAYIQKDLAARLRNGRDLPPHWTLDSLAEHYQVSFTPVRAAVARLIDEGLLEKGPNRRLMPGQPAVGKSGRKVRARQAELPLPPDDPFPRIANDLVKLSLAGEPVYLREEATAEKYAMSRSAMRNILHRLAGAGVVDHIPRRGWRVRPFRREDLQAFIEVREVLELKALELARPHLEAEELQRLLDANRLPASGDEWPDNDNGLHGYLIEKAGNPYIKEFFQRQGRYYDLLFQWEDLDRDTSIETVRQHREILTALLDKDWRGAQKALSHHIRCNHPILSRIQPAAKSSTENSAANDNGHARNRS